MIKAYLLKPVRAVLGRLQLRSSPKRTSGSLEKNHTDHSGFFFNTENSASKAERSLDISIRDLFDSTGGSIEKLNKPHTTGNTLSTALDDQPDIRIYSSHAEYMDDLADRQAKRKHRNQAEAQLIKVPEKAFTVNGYCAVCKANTKFSVDFKYAYEKDKQSNLIPNWRESLVCASCGMNNRIRAVIDLFTSYIKVEEDAAIYACEQLTPFFNWLQKNYARVIGSEFLGDNCNSGQVYNGLRHEDITRLSFPDACVDYILSFEVLEHVPDTERSLHEYMRVLRRGGFVLASAPFVSSSYETIVRARMNNDGSIEHLLEPEYHGNPTNPEEGSLCFYHFGWDLLDKFRAAGASDAAVISYYSSRNANLGNEQLFFLILK